MREKTHPEALSASPKSEQLTAGQQFEELEAEEQFLEMCKRQGHMPRWP